MPYPLENLPYGLRRRFRELATPAEAYALQIATPTYIGFQPLQMCERTPQVEIMADIHDPSQLRIRLDDMSETLERLQPNQLINVVDRIELIKVTPIHKDIIDAHIICDGNISISLWNCHVDKPFIQSFIDPLKYSNLLLNKCTITAKNATKLIEDLPPFYRKERFTIFDPPSMNVWTTAFNEVDSPILQRCSVKYVASSAFDFNLDTLVKFVDKQARNFDFVFATQTRTDYDEINTLLKTVFQTHFEAFEWPGFDTEGKKCLTINFKHECRYYWLKSNVV